MPAAPIPANDTARVDALRAYHVLDTARDEAFDRLTRLAAGLLDMPVALISLIDADRQWHKSAVGLALREVPRDDAFCAHTILRAEPMMAEDARLDPRFAANPLVTGPPGIRFYAGAPLVTADGFRIGALCVIDHVPRRLEAAQLRQLAELAATVVTTLELYRALRAMKSLALTDGMTGLPNRGHFLQCLQEAVDAAARDRTPFSLICLDCDNFKNVNDLYGHHVGDDLLKTLAALIRDKIRPGDIAARLGGDEFAVLLAAVDPATARAIAERLLRGGHQAMQARQWPVTLSMGVVTFLAAPRDIDEALSVADAAMYVAKRGGKAQLRAITVGGRPAPQADDRLPALMALGA